MNLIRLATDAEVERIRADSALDSSCVVMALDTQSGVQLAVKRISVEIDPVFFTPECSDRTKLFFVRDIATGLSFQGVPCFYFNVSAAAEDAAWCKIVEAWGAEPLSRQPEIRYRKVL